MKINIPNEIFWLGIGIGIGLTIACEYNAEIVEFLKEKQKLEERRKNKVVDLNGDTVGHMDEKGNIIGDDKDE